MIIEYQEKKIYKFKYVDRIRIGKIFGFGSRYIFFSRVSASIFFCEADPCPGHKPCLLVMKELQVAHIQQLLFLTGSEWSWHRFGSVHRKKNQIQIRQSEKTISGSDPTKKIIGSEFNSGRHPGSGSELFYFDIKFGSELFPNTNRPKHPKPDPKLLIYYHLLHLTLVLIRGGDPPSFYLWKQLKRLFF